MTVSVLSGTSGALYYKPAGTLGTFSPADVTTASAEMVVDTYLNFQVGDPVKFSVINAQTGAAGTGTLPGGLTAGTTYYVNTYTAATGVLKVSATAAGSSVTLTTTGTAVSPNAFRVEYADYAVVGQVRDWSFEISRSEIDVTTIGQTPGQYAPFKTYIAGFADGNGSATVYMTDEDAALSNRMIQDVLQRKQVGCAFKLYTDRVMSGSSIDEATSRSLSMNAVLTSASLSIDPENAQSVAINFRPADSVSFDFSTSA
jgi:hypothetical protein